MTGDAGRQVTQQFRRESYRPNTKEVYTMLMTVAHPSWVDDIRVASDNSVLLPDAGIRGVISRGKEYLFLPFEIELPSQDETGISKCSISIDNVDRIIVAAVRGAVTPPMVTLEVILTSAPDTVEISYTDFRLDRVGWDAFVVTGEISLEYFDAEPFPWARVTPADFPGIF